MIRKIIQISATDDRGVIALCDDGTVWQLISSRWSLLSLIPQLDIPNENDLTQKALDIADAFAGYDGAHHKDWCIDQIVRALTGCPMIRQLGVDCNGKMYSYEAQGESDAYREFVRLHCEGEDGPETYAWEKGISP